MREHLAPARSLHDRPYIRNSPRAHCSPGTSVAKRVSSESPTLFPTLPPSEAATSHVARSPKAPARAHLCPCATHAHPARPRMNRGSSPLRAQSSQTPVPCHVGTPRGVLSPPRRPREGPRAPGLHTDAEGRSESSAFPHSRTPTVPILPSGTECGRDETEGRYGSTVANAVRRPCPPRRRASSEGCSLCIALPHPRPEGRPVQRMSDRVYSPSPPRVSYHRSPSGRNSIRSNRCPGSPIFSSVAMRDHQWLQCDIPRIILSAGPPRPTRAEVLWKGSLRASAP
ncbi:hypothetical protein C8Q77DRAFT_524674 [Trametes polyzona]|nr:hypothetical protein C8Q77DRAFT_524674 [Trametes polyzona]